MHMIQGREAEATNIWGAIYRAQDGFDAHGPRAACRSTDELPENVGFQRHSRAQLSAGSNAMCESFFGTLESELLARERFDTHEQARRRLFWFLEGWYYVRRLHSSIGYRSPLEFEDLNTTNLIVSPCGLPTVGRRRGRDRRSAARPWTTRDSTLNGG